MSKRGVAVIGLGMAVTPHAKSLLDLEDRVEVKAAVSRSEARREAFARQFPFPVTGDLDAVIDDPGIDAVLLLTPPNAREDIVRRLASRGKPILMEKPVERSTEAARRIVETCEAAGITTGVVFQHRFREASERLRGLIAAGSLGELAMASLHLPWWRPQSYYDEPGRGSYERDGGGVLISQAIHALDLMLSFTGPVAEVAAVVATTRLHAMESEDFTGAGLVFANGAPGALMATTARFPGRPERLELVGTKAAAALEAGVLELDHEDGRSERFGETVGTGGGADPMAFPHDWHKAVVTDFLDALDEGRKPRVSARDALSVHSLIDALTESSRSGRKVRPG